MGLLDLYDVVTIEPKALCECRQDVGEHTALMLISWAENKRTYELLLNAQLACDPCRRSNSTRLTETRPSVSCDCHNTQRLSVAVTGWVIIQCFL